jgi:hypothetical protein
MSPNRAIRHLLATGRVIITAARNLTGFHPESPVLIANLGTERGFFRFQINQP